MNDETVKAIQAVNDRVTIYALALALTVVVLVFTVVLLGVQIDALNKRVDRVVQPEGR